MGGEDVLRPSRERVRRLVARHGPARRTRAPGLGPGGRRARRADRLAAAATHARRGLRNWLPDAPPAWRGGRARPERADAHARTRSGAAGDVRPRRRARAPVRERRVRPGLHELLLLPPPTA